MLPESITALDLSVLDFIRHTLASPVADVIMTILTYSVEYGASLIIAFIVMMFIKSMRKTGAAMLASSVLALLLGELVLKNIICRPRPFMINGSVDLIIKAPSGFSFPSSHTAVCFAAATAIFMFHKRLGIAAYIYATAVAFSRMYLYVHYPSDVLGGIVLGICCGLISVTAIKFIGGRIESQKKKNSAEKEQSQ